MNTKRKITSGILAAAFALSITPNISHADHAQGVSDSAKMIVDDFVMKYSNMDMERRMTINERISSIKQTIRTNSAYGNSRMREALYNVIDYADVEIDNFDAVVNASFSDATDLNLTLQSLLKQHVNVALDTLRLAYDGSEGFDASLEELDKNSVALADTIASVYGENTGDAFLELWRNHIDFFANLTIGAKTGDNEMVEEAMENLEQYKIDAANFFSRTIPSVEYSQVFAGAKEHGELLTNSMLAYIDGDYDEAYELQAQADTQIEGLADLLSGGIVKQYPNLFSNYNVENQNQARMTTSSDLRLELNDILREHVNIALDTLRTAYDGKDNFDAAFEELDNNSVELANVVASVYGAEAGEDFLELWRNHIDFFANLTLGAKSGDDEMVDEAMENLDQYKVDAANFFSNAIPFITYDSVFQGAKVHGQLLTDSMLAYIDEDYDEAFELQTQADAQIQGLADLLTKGITMQYPETFTNE